MIEVKKFSAVLDTDNDVTEVQPTSHIDARNVVFRGDGASKRVQNMLGTTLIPNTNLPDGDNQEIAKHYDAVRQRIYYFNWNSQFRHGIYYYDIKTATIVPVLISLVNSTDDVLLFNLDRPIASIHILYGDNDVLLYCDSLKVPCAVNVSLRLKFPATAVTREDVKLIKSPPTTPPTATFANDSSVTVNNNYKELIQFRYRFVYPFFEKSVMSSISALPLPVNSLNPSIAADPTKNSRIDITLETGSASVGKIELIARKSLGTTYSKWYLVDTLDKTKLSIANNSTYTYQFFNDAFYNFVDDKEANLLFDLIPDEANDLELLNGNSLIFGGIKEGLSRDVTLDITVASTPVLVDNANFNSSIATWAWKSRAGIGIAYFSKEGKTNGVFVDMTKKLQTSPYSESTGFTTVPRVDLSISHRPPVWADYYHWVRTENSTKGNFLELATNATFKDEKYAYISLESLDKYLEDNPTAKETQSYDFLVGDRITFFKKINNDGTTSTVLTNKDFEILGIVSDPIVSDRIKGRFIKIALPLGLDSTFDFGTVGGNQFNNYLIELYTPAKTNADAEVNTYYEFGERYGIGNAGQPNRYHLGQLQNQTANLSQPATFKFIKGDVYLRRRTLTIGNIIRYVIAPESYDNAWYEIHMDLISQSYVNPNYTVSPQARFQLLRTLFVGQLDANSFLNNTSSSPKNFRIQTTLNFNVNSDNTTIYLFVSFGGPYTIFQLETNVTPRNYFFEPRAFNKGQQSVKIDQTITLAAHTKAWVLLCVPTGTGITWSACDFIVTEAAPYTQYLQDRNFSDFYQSSVNSNGRPLVIDESQKETYNPALLRWGQAYQQGTNINQTNRFYPEDFDEVDRAKGDIQRLKVRERILRIFQNRAVGKHGIYSRFVRQAGSEASLVTTNDIITANNVDYYVGDHGIGYQYTSLVSSADYDYFSDPVRGDQCRVAPNGVQVLTDLYKGQYTIKSYLTPYNKKWTRANGSIARIHGYFDYAENQFVTILQGGVNGEDTIEDIAFAFQERQVGNPSYTAFYDLYADGFICAEEMTYGWKNGQLHIFNNSTTNNFFGVQYDAYITVPFNQNTFQKKLYQSLSQQGNVEWPCSLIYTDTESYYGQRQESNLLSSEFRPVVGSKFQAALMRDAHSVGGISEGNKMRGSYLVVKFHIPNASTFAYLSLVEVKFQEQQLNPK